MNKISKRTLLWAGVISQDRERCQFLFCLAINPLLSCLRVVAIAVKVRKSYRAVFFSSSNQKKSPKRSSNGCMGYLR